MNTGGKLHNSSKTASSQLYSLADWDKVTYALEGSIFVVEAPWCNGFATGLHRCIYSSEEVEALAAVPDTDGVYFVPALTGLGAPYWSQYARGSISGISRGTTTAHIARAASRDCLSDL